MVRAAADRPGVLYAFIVLDNPANSILDMQVRRGRVGWRVGSGARRPWGWAGGMGQEPRRRGVMRGGGGA